MSKTSVCRICLAVDVRLFSISGPLQMVFEKITNTILHTSDGRPVVACYMCYAQLNKCHKLMLTSARAENVLNAILYNHSKITVQSVSQFDRRANGLCVSLCCSKAEYFDNLKTDTVVQIKEEIKSDIECEGSEASPQPDIADIHDMKIECDIVNICDIKKDCVEEYQFNYEIDIKEEFEEDNASGQTLGADKRKQGEDRKTNKKQNRPKKKPKTLTDQGPNQCNVCQRMYKQKSHLSRHLKTHADKNPFKCDLCKHRYARKDILIRHLNIVHGGKKVKKSVHEDEKRFKCDVCERRFSRKDNLIIHSRTHTGDRPFECDMCLRRFIHKSNLVSHLRTHTGDKPYECYICYHRFIDKDNLQIHIRTHW